MHFNLKRDGKVEEAKRQMRKNKANAKRRNTVKKETKALIKEKTNKTKQESTSLAMVSVFCFFVFCFVFLCFVFCFFVFVICFFFFVFLQQQSHSKPIEYKYLNDWWKKNSLKHPTWKYTLDPAMVCKRFPANAWVYDLKKLSVLCWCAEIVRGQQYAHKPGSDTYESSYGLQPCRLKGSKRPCNWMGRAKALEKRTQYKGTPAHNYQKRDSCPQNECWPVFFESYKHRDDVVAMATQDDPFPDDDPEWPVTWSLIETRWKERGGDNMVNIRHRPLCKQILHDVFNLLLNSFRRANPTLAAEYETRSQWTVDPSVPDTLAMFGKGLESTAPGQPPLDPTVYGCKLSLLFWCIWCIKLYTLLLLSCTHSVKGKPLTIEQKADVQRLKDNRQQWMQQGKLSWILADRDKTHAVINAAMTRAIEDDRALRHALQRKLNESNLDGINVLSDNDNDDDDDLDLSTLNDNLSQRVSNFNDNVSHFDATLASVNNNLSKNNSSNNNSNHNLSNNILSKNNSSNNNSNNNVITTLTSDQKFLLLQELSVCMLCMYVCV